MCSHDAESTPGVYLQISSTAQTWATLEVRHVLETWRRLRMYQGYSFEQSDLLHL